MSYTLSLRLDGLPPLQRSAARGHWAKDAGVVKRWRERTAFEIGRHKPRRPLVRAELEFERHSASEPDFDNLVASFKPILDGIVLAGVLADDKPSNIGSPRYYWRKASRGGGFVTVKLREA